MTSPLPAVIFDFCDADQNGKISKEELLRVSVALYNVCFGTGDETLANKVRCAFSRPRV